MLLCEIVLCSSVASDSVIYSLSLHDALPILDGFDVDVGVDVDEVGQYRFIEQGVSEYALGQLGIVAGRLQIVDENLGACRALHCAPLPRHVTARAATDGPVSIRWEQGSRPGRAGSR